MAFNISITFGVDRAMEDELRAYADKINQPISAIIREAVGQFLDRTHIPTMKEAMPHIINKTF